MPALSALSQNADHIRTLGEELLIEPLRHANNLATLLAAVFDKDLAEDVRKAAIRALSLFFADALQSGQLHGLDEATNGGSANEKYRAWLSRHFKSFRSQLYDFLALPAKSSVQVAALSAVLDLSKGPKEKVLLPAGLTVAVELLLCSRHPSPEVLAVLSEHCLAFVDVRYFTLKAIHGLASRATVKDAVSSDSANTLGLSKVAAAKLKSEDQVTLEQLCWNVHALLVAAKPPPPAAEGEFGKRKAEGGVECISGQRSWSGYLEAGTVNAIMPKASSKPSKKRQRLMGSAKAEAQAQDETGAKWATPSFQKKAFSNAWLSFLCLPLPEELYKKVLVRLHEDVIPYLANPYLLVDLLSAALDGGGLLGMLALHAIFVLVTKHGLEYPAFYARLYQLLRPAALYAKQRSRFFQLADVFLSSALVPAYTIAAFIKRFSRLAMFAPPAGALVCLGFVHNLLRRHPACLVLVDRKPAGNDPGRDPYRAEESDPAASNALDSSLWEVEGLANHYYPQVAAAAKQILEKDLADRRKTAEVDMQQLWGGSYTSLLKTELGRRIRQVPVAFYATPPTALFGEDSAFYAKRWLQ